MDVETELNSIGGDMCALTPGGCAYMPKDNGVAAQGGLDPGTEPQFRPPPPPPTPPREKCAIADNLVQRAGIAVLGFFARLTGGTVGQGAGAAAGGGMGLGAGVGTSRQVVVSPTGAAAFETTYTFNVSPAGMEFGVGAYGGIQFSYSPASDPAVLAGSSLNVGIGGGDGIGAGLDANFGASAQYTLSLGAGLNGMGGGGLFSATGITPICGHSGG